MPQPLIKIPDSLCMAGRYEEALQWCDHIGGQYGSHKNIFRMLEKKEGRDKKQNARRVTGGASSSAAGRN